MLCHLPKVTDPRLLVGIDTADDAGVYQLNETTALIQTVDFFTPIVDDPYLFGQIAAANSLSDVYAMGGKPLTAMNIVGFPLGKLPGEVLKAILQGGQEKVTEAIGTGVLATAARAELFSAGVEAAVKGMAELNRKAAEVMEEFPVNACTDITGFGLLGHAYEMASASQVDMELVAAHIPLLPEAAEAAAMGLVPGGAYANREYLTQVKMSPEVPGAVQDLCFDPQTSGGLFISVDCREGESLLKALRQAGLSQASIIGEVKQRGRGDLYVR